MEARSITRIDDTIKALINQGLSDQINEMMTDVQLDLAQGNMKSASNVVRELTQWVEEKIWSAYLTAIFECTYLLKNLRKLAGSIGYHLVSYQEIMITLSTGSKIEVRSPFFVKSSPKRGRKKRGPQGRGTQLLLFY